jgi:superfamily II DNA or RNA helicase
MEYSSSLHFLSSSTESSGSFSYIYVRTHESYDIYNAIKLGKANNIPERDSVYATGEIKRGKFIMVFEVYFKQVLIIERLLQNYFKKDHIKIDSGTEFYHKSIIDRIENYLLEIGIYYKKLTTNEIDNLMRCNRIHNTIQKIKKVVKLISNELYNKKGIIYTPRVDQEEIIERSISYFTRNDKGILSLMCGVGKTLISLWITEKMYCNTILIGVPNILLLNQWRKEVKNIFPNKKCFIVYGSITSNMIYMFLKCNKNDCIIITTYASSYKVREITEKLSFQFDMKINDEVHHLTTSYMNTENTKRYIEMLKIKSIKQLSLTATMKEIENIDIDKKIVSNNNIEYFGEIIDKKSLLWAIKENIICDYVIQTVLTDNIQLEENIQIFNITDENDKRLFLSAFTTLKSIYDGHSHHLLIYSNNKENSLKIIQYIDKLLESKYFELPDLYYSNYHSDMKSYNQSNIISKFQESKNGIISCVYCLGEGWDFPLLDGEVFSENMTSVIRIVQSALRACRKNKKEPNKIAKIILPILNNEDWLEKLENQDFRKVSEVIYQMGLEDETIISKIKAYKIKVEKHFREEKAEKKDESFIDDFGEYDAELTEKIKLKTVKRVQVGISYEKAKKIIKENNTKSKMEYYELCDRDSRLSKDPEILFKGKFTNWIEYLGIERIYYEIDICKKKIQEYLILYSEIKQNNLDLHNTIIDLCKKDDLFPPYDLWVDYYNISQLKDMFIISTKKKKLGLSI